MIRAIRDDGSRHVLAIIRSAMQLTTLMEMLEQEIGVSPSARAKLDVLLTERAKKDATARPGAKATESRPAPRSRKRTAR